MPNVNSTSEMADEPDEDLNFDALAEHTYSAVFSDICDQHGYREQTAEPGLLPLTGGGRLIGWARTFVAAPVEEPPARPYGNEIDFIDALRPHEVAVGDASGKPVAAWGELFSTAATGRGARGAVIDGYIRDVAPIRHLGFPVFARGTRPTDSFGRLSIRDTDVPVRIAGVRVDPGDLVVADEDGVTVVPRRLAVEVARQSQEKANTENHARDLLMSGGKLADVWERFRVL